MIQTFDLREHICPTVFIFFSDLFSGWRLLRKKQKKNCFCSKGILFVLFMKEQNDFPFNRPVLTFLP